MSIHSYIYEDAQEASAACAIKMLGLLEESLAASPVATLAISGGSTPKLLFGELAKARFDWSRVHLFWVDERGVPPHRSTKQLQACERTLHRSSGLSGQ
jgi:6-phosphogluconolactonase